MPKKVERIRDPIHNIVPFEMDNPFEHMLWELIQQSPFQRLRRIKQLGFSEFVYPGATHSRFAHSVGTFHTARQLMKIVQSYLGVEFEERPARVALTACLCHDLGHGALSHAFHDVIRVSNIDFPKHELVSRDLVLEMDKVLGGIDGAFARDVAHLIERTASETNTPRTIYDAVVSSQFDADRLDYMRRDRIMAGSLHGAIDYDWLLANLEIEKVSVSEEASAPRVPTFVVGRKALHAAEAYVLALFQLYPTIYFHKATRGAEVIFIELMRLVIENARGAGGADPVLPANHPISKFARSPDLNSYKDLDDTVCWGSLWQLRKCGSERIADLASRLLERRLLKCFDARDIIHRRLRDTKDRTEREEATDAALKSLRQRVDTYRSISKKLILYDTYERSPYHKLVSGRSALNQIMARDASGGIYDLAELSPAVGAVQNFKVNRYYYDREDGDCAEALASLVDEAMKHPPMRE